MAALPLNMPTTRPRRLVNQRLATVAPSTLAVTPVERPSMRPHVIHNCHTAVIWVDSAKPSTISPRHATQPQRRIIANVVLKP